MNVYSFKRYIVPYLLDLNGAKGQYFCCVCLWSEKLMTEQALVDGIDKRASLCRIVIYLIWISWINATRMLAGIWCSMQDVY